MFYAVKIRHTCNSSKQLPVPGDPLIYPAEASDTHVLGGTNTRALSSPR